MKGPIETITYWTQTKKATQMMLDLIPFAKGFQKQGHCNASLDVCLQYFNLRSVIPHKWARIQIVLFRRRLADPYDFFENSADFREGGFWAFIVTADVNAWHHLILFGPPTCLNVYNNKISKLNVCYTIRIMWASQIQKFHLNL